GARRKARDRASSPPEQARPRQCVAQPEGQGPEAESVHGPGRLQSLEAAHRPDGETRRGKARIDVSLERRRDRPDEPPAPPAALAPAGALVDEVEDASPRILRRGSELLLLAAEEAVRGTVVHHELVLDARLVEGLLERGIVLGRDVLVGAALQGEDRRIQLPGPLDRPGIALAVLARTPVEADRSGQAMTAGSGEP